MSDPSKTFVSDRNSGKGIQGLLSRIEHISNEPRQVGKLSAHDNGMLEVTGFAYPLGYSGRVIATDGREISAEVVGFKGSRALMIPMVQDAPLKSGSRVLPYVKSNEAAVGDALFGRIIGPMGDPIDGKGPILATESVPLLGMEGNVMRRASVTTPIDMGIRALNGLLTIGRGQRLAIIAGSGVGKSMLINQILDGVVADVVVVGLIGERGREVNDFVTRRNEKKDAVPTITVAVPADHSPSSRLKAAHRATAIAEHYRSEGKSVVLVIDSLTRVAHAQREIGLAAGEPPTMKGYPPSALSMIPRLIERAGNDSETGGSITAIYTVLADGDDLDDPVVDNARAIADGHIILSRSLAEQGIFPAIDVGKSISRVAVDIIDEDHHIAQTHFRRLWSIYEENRDLVLMGAYQAGSDPDIDEALAQWPIMVEYLKQKPRELVNLQQSISDLSGLFQS
ncbi:FliI/YscN family ATPase [Parasphingorhabdus litoris]|uniref:Flagellum-specific ATP synthase n=1 Tax=Parasphingorhabdus litoris TaxID=394733 RepID=A0ABP3JY22_9SPHN|nr:FliI/YscN family ATPase [Parasphingorhabdus litoris]